MISVKAELAGQNYKYKEASEKVGIPAQTFYRKLKDNRFTIEETEQIMALIGKKLVLVDREQ